MPRPAPLHDNWHRWRGRPGSRRQFSAGASREIPGRADDHAERLGIVQTRHSEIAHVTQSGMADADALPMARRLNFGHSMEPCSRDDGTDS
jgi:hypothetical protein